MKGSYKVYNANKGEWVNLPLNYKGDGLLLKIENNHLWSSYDGEKTWEDVGSVGIKNALTINSKGIANIDSITIGNFKIENEGKFNYTFVGTIPSVDWYYNITAEWNHEEAVKKEIHVSDNCETQLDFEGHFYTFEITDCTCSDEENGSCTDYIGRELFVPAYLIDDEYSSEDIDAEGTLFFDDNGRTERVLIRYTNLIDAWDDCSLFFPEGYFIKSVPFAIRNTSKVTLNGFPVITSDSLNSAKEEIINECVSSHEEVAESICNVTNDGSKFTVNVDYSNADADETCRTVGVFGENISLKCLRNFENEDARGMSAHISKNSVSIYNIAWDMENSEVAEHKVFEIDSDGNVYILKNGSLQKLQDLV